MHDDPDDDSLRSAFDLDAWAPPATPDVTAAVIARMTAPIARTAATTTMVEHRPATARTRRTWILAGVGFGATAIGALVTYLLMRDGAPGSDHGTVATATPSRLDLGASSAQLEADTELSWHRDGHTLRVDQLRGTSTWTLGPDETLEIKAGGAKRRPYEDPGTGRSDDPSSGNPNDPSGAAAGRGNDQVAIRATGASLRVEVGMNLSDAKIIGASAIAASAVAAITIVVYEGQAHVTSAGQTVEMRAGGTLEARADRAPAPREHVGGAVSDEGDLADRKKLHAAIDELRRAAATCPNGTAALPTAVELVLDITPDGGAEISRLDFTPSPPDAADLCINEHVLAQRFAATRLGGRFRLSFELTKRCDAEVLARATERASGDGRHSDAAVYRAAAKACSESCDFATPAARLDSAIARGDYAEAIEAGDAAYACKHDPGILARSFLAACNGRFATKAVEIYQRLSPEAQAKYSQMCTRNGVNLDPPMTVADATGSKDPDLQAARVALADRKWDIAIEAAERAKGHPEAKEIYENAHRGSRADAAMRRMEDALRRGEYGLAAKELAKTKEWATISADAEKAFTTITAPEVARLITTAKSRALSDGTCAAFRAHIAFVVGTYPQNMSDRVRLGSGTCRPKVEAGSGSGSAVATPSKNPECKPEKVKENRAQLDAAISRGAYAEAVAAADRVLACGFDVNVLMRGFLAACNGRDATTARRYFKSMSADTREKYKQMCIRNGIALP